MKGHIFELDGLRAIAVTLVIISHWLPENHFLNILPNGAIGVHLFFVLSGYLITDILFSSRGKQNAIKNFYIRRSLRIFPIYYLLLLVLFIGSYFSALVANTNIRVGLLYHLTYTSNIYFSIHSWDGVLSPLWSLSVEEQFYLVWPSLILFVHQKHLLRVILVFMDVGVGCMFLFNGLASAILTPPLFFSFGLGGLLSWFRTYRKELLPNFNYTLNIVALFSLALFAYHLYKPSAFPLTIFIDVLSLWAINWAINNRSFLSTPPLVYVGKISYGLYLYHNLIPSLITEPFIQPYVPGVPYVSQVVSFLILLAVAWASFRFIETPFLNLKERFAYSPKKRTIELVS